MRSDFSTSFTRDMAPELAERYLAWLPFGREAIATTISEFVKPNSLKQFVGSNGNLDDSEIAKSHGAWLDPWQPYLQRTGKMLRPYLTSFSLEAYGCDPKDYPHQVAMAEFVHSSSLILDDIVDDSRFRRGGPSAHSQVGVLAAGAAGSVWLNLGFEIVWRDRARLGKHATSRIIEELAWEHFVTGLGTTLDLTWPLTGGGHTANEYLQEIMHRSASYTYRLPLKIGALAAGVDDAEVARLAMFGQQVGLAFQIIDDVLNVSSTDKHWGKEIAEDITQGKITLQVILAREHGTEKQRTRLSQILSSGSHDPEVLAEAVSIFEATGALDESRSIAAALQADALSIVDSLHISESHRSRLREFTDYVLRRTR